MVQKNDRGSPLAIAPIALIALAGAASCALFASKPPCNSDSNCPAGQVCDLETKACVERAGTDSGVGPHDAGADATLTDSAVADGAGADAVAPDRAPADSAAADQLVPDAASPDLRRADAARPDSWRPDTSTFDAAGCIDNDGDEYGTACARGPDCDDDNNAIHDGTACDDGNGATSHDTCRAGECFGVFTSAASCTAGCSTCGAGPCCTQDCPRSGCTACPTDCSCFNTFSDTPGHAASLTCNPGSRCALVISGGGGAVTTCNGATCFLDCSPINDQCTMICQNGAACILYCANNGSNCTITGCTQQNCSDGQTAVCNAACP